jgi:hypothetical protein
MPAVTPAEPHNPERYGSPHAIRPARLRAPPQPAAPSFPSPCSPCPPWFAFSVPSVSCPMWGRLSSLRPAFQPALAPLPTTLPHPIAPPVEQAARLAMPAVTPAEQHNPEWHGSSHAIRPARPRAPPQPAPFFPSPCPPWSPCSPCRGLLFSVFSVSSVVCFSPCPPCSLWFAFLRVLRVLCGLPSPCSLWFAFSVPSPPPVTTFPKSFSLSFSTTSQLPLSLLLLPSCMLKVKGAADALVGARTADGASPGQRRRRPQPLPSPDGGELRSLKPAAGGEQAGGGLLT